MRLDTRHIPVTLASWTVLLFLATRTFGQGTSASLETTQAAVLPEAPLPELAMAADPSPMAQQPTPAGVQSSSSSQPGEEKAEPQKSDREKAEEQLKAQEKQRVMGVMATFNTTRNKDALPLSSGQKYRLFFKSATDPWAFGLAGVVAGIGQAGSDYPEWGQGTQGYAKKYGAAYTDYFTGNFFGNAVLPSLWHEDPRYFQKGTGTMIGRFGWAATSTVWCKRDKGGWGPNYANVIGNLIGAAIARAYYPASERTVGDTLQDGLTVTAEGIVGSEVIEFWPDMVRHYRRKKAEKLARQQAATDARSSAEKGAQSAPATKQNAPNQ